MKVWGTMQSLTKAMATAMTDINQDTTPTPESNAEQIAQLTGAISGLNTAVDVLVSQAIRPSLQQTKENQQSISQLIDLMDRHAQAIVQIDERIGRLEGVIASLADRTAQHDQWLKEARSQQAENSSLIAQIGIKQDHSAEGIRELKALVTANGNQIMANGNQIAALAETSRTQLAGIIASSRRIDRLEQQAS